MSTFCNLHPERGRVKDGDPVPDYCDIEKCAQKEKPALPTDIRSANEKYATMRLGYCPECRKKINSVNNSNYCGKCGQAIIWD